MKDVYIYSLTCPKTGKIKYIGKTVNPKKRKYQHNSIYRKWFSNSYLSIVDKCKFYLRLSGYKPIFTIIDSCKFNDWSDLEKYHISLHENLLNMTKGGEGFHGTTVSSNHMSSRTKGKKIEDVYPLEQCIEIKQKLSNWFTGRVMGTDHHTKEYLEKQVKSNSKVPLLVIDVIDNIEYTFINSKEAATYFNCGHSLIRTSKNKNWLLKRRYLVRDLVS